MELLNLIVLLAIIGIALYVFLNYVPMPELYKRVVVAIIVLIILAWAVRLLLGGSPVITVVPR